MSKYQFTASDIYLPGTDIPKNHLGITEPELLHEVEETLLQQAYQTFISECETSTRFDEIYFKALHQRTFECLYDWAGVYRTVDMSKGSSLFCRAAYLEQESRRIFLQLEQENFLQHSENFATIKICRSPRLLSVRINSTSSHLRAQWPYHPAVFRFDSHSKWLCPN